MFKRMKTNYLNKIENLCNNSTSSIISEWFIFLKDEKGFSNHTCEAYISDLYFFCDFLKKNYQEIIDKNLLKNLKLKDFRGFLTYVSKKREGSSKARTLSSIKNFYKFCEINETFSNEAIGLVRSPKKPKKLPRAISKELTFDAIENISSLEYMKRNPENWVSFRDYTLLNLLYCCGLRISEALNLRVKDIEESGFLRIKGKGKKERIVPIFDEISIELKDLVANCPYCSEEENTLIFFGKRGNKLNPAVFQKTVRQLKDILGLPEGSTPHAFRHSFATHLLSSSQDLRSIQELLGHSSISSTQKYTKIETSKMLETFSNI